IRGTSRGMYANRDVDSYRFQATSSDTLTMTIDTLGSNAQAQLNALTGPLGVCPQIALVPAANTPLFVTRCATGIQTFSAPVVAGTWYVINVVGGITVQNNVPSVQFGGQMPGGTTYQYKLSVSIGGPPANDNCAAAANLPLQATYTSGSTALSTNDGTSSCDPTGRDVWFNVTTPAGGPFALNIDTCGSAIDTVVTVYNTCGGAEVVCNDDCGGAPCGGSSSCLSFAAAPSTTYKVRVSDKGIGGGGGFLVRAQTVIANDTCSGAITIVSPSSTNSSTVGASLDAGVPVCDGPGVADSGGNNAITAPSVWYRIVGTGATMYADVLVASYDTKLSVYQGPCGSLACVTMNDDVPSTPTFRSKVAWRTLPGVEYFVMVHGFGTGSGTFTLNVTDSPTPSNDNCALATAIGGGSGSIGGTNVGATGDPSTITSSTLASCATVHTYWDTWYAWTAPCSDNVTFGTCGGFDTILSVHSTCPTLGAGNMITGACNDNGTGLCAPGSQVTLPVIGGTTYLVRVATAGALTASPGGGAGYSLTWSMPDTDADGTIDCLDGCPLDPAKIAPGACGCGFPETDTDADGTPDCIDGCPLDPAKIAPGVCGCGVSDVDTDADGTPDCIDGCPLDPAKIAPGVCGCGVAETDTDADGTPDCVDGCPLDPAKIAPGTCGCGVPDTDGDADGVADCIDNCPLDPNPSQSDCDSNGMGDVCEISSGSQPDCDGNGVPDNCDPDCNATGLPDACDIAAATSFDLNGNGIPDECEAGNGFQFCFGDVGCPCGNNGLPGEGCVNGTGRGALLYNAGGTSVFLDNAAPLAIQMRASKPMLFVLGASQVNGGNGNPFFDGKRCVSVTKRFQPQTSSPTGTGVATQPVFKSGGLILPGSTWYFQTWFRDQPGVCGMGVNLSNGLGITFTP
ncbi:MAG TPA: hypothetical protein VK843_10555, partial [Planctomycetota bacterium]|nr:hypothetical protein [Planctomycetota bacterium]